MLVKNISLEPVLVRVMGVKTSVDAGEVVDMTAEEAEGVTSMYPNIFEKVSENSQNTEESANEEAEGDKGNTPPVTEETQAKKPAKTKTTKNVTK